MNIWIELQRAARAHNGEPIETSLLGKVPYIRNELGDLVGYIPTALQMQAKNYGLVITEALYKEDRYVLRTLP